MNRVEYSKIRDIEAVEIDTRTHTHIQKVLKNV